MKTHLQSRFGRSTKMAGVLAGDHCCTNANVVRPDVHLPDYRQERCSLDVMMPDEGLLLIIIEVVKASPSDNKTSDDGVPTYDLNHVCCYGVVVLSSRL